MEQKNTVYEAAEAKIEIDLNLEATIEELEEKIAPGHGENHNEGDSDLVDVWDPFSCHVYNFPSLRRLQQRIRKRLGLTDREYLQLKRALHC